MFLFQVDLGKGKAFFVDRIEGQNIDDFFQARKIGREAFVVKSEQLQKGVLLF